LNDTNRLLSLLPEKDFAALRPHLQHVSLDYGQPLIIPQEPIRFIYFPTTSLASLVAVLEDGSTVEAGAVGREGMVGVPVILHAGTTPMQTLVQIAGDSYRIDAAIVLAEFEKRGALHGILTRYVHTLFVVASQSTACNRKHGVEARLARWLLMSSDGIGSNQVAITQEFLAVMLGVRRSGVTEAALKLQATELIRYSRGLVEITNRPGLEAATCECYHVVKREYERLFGALD
jgi:CRP-like cAMP-binding protein